MIQVNSKEFFDLIKNLNVVIKDNNNMPFLKMVKIIFKENTITAIGDDLETRIENTIDTSVQFDREFCVDYNLLRKILSSIPNQSINLEFEKTKLKISSTKFEYKLSLEDETTFPGAEFEVEHELELDINEFKEALINSHRMITPDSDMMTALSSVHCHINGNITLIGASQWCIYKQIIKNDFKNEMSLLISERSTSSIIKIFDKPSDIKIGVSDRALEFKQGALRVVCLMPNIKPLNLQQLFDKSKQSFELMVDFDDFKNTIISLSNFTGPSINSARFKVEKNSLKISLNDHSNIINCDYEINCENEDGFDMNYPINNLLRTIKSFTKPKIIVTDTMLFRFVEEDREALLTPIKL